MIENKDMLKSRIIIQQLISDERIIKADKEFVKFFMKKAEDALETAHILFQISKSISLKKELNVSQFYNGYLWVINPAYYSMFYAATSLLAHFDKRIKVDQGIHKIMYHALVYYFLDNDKKLTRYIIEQYKQAESDAESLLQIAELKARYHIEKIKFELDKRKEFTYEMGKTAEENKAQTSIKRAEEFLTLVKEIIL